MLHFCSSGYLGQLSGALMQTSTKIGKGEVRGGKRTGMPGLILLALSVLWCDEGSSRAYGGLTPLVNFPRRCCR